MFEVESAVQVVADLLEEQVHLVDVVRGAKTGAGRLEEFSPRRLTVFDIRLDLVAWSVENHLGFR